MDERRSRYEAHLASPEWQVSRADVMKRAGGVCETCCEETARHVHHLDYRRFGRERPADLVAVCVDCHEAIHERDAAAPRRVRQFKLIERYWLEMEDWAEESKTTGKRPWADQAARIAYAVLAKHFGDLLK